MIPNRKNDLILIMTPEKQDKTLELSKHWSVDSTPARNEVMMKRTYPVQLVKCDKICKVAASDYLKISQVEVISECESLLNLSMRMPS